MTDTKKALEMAIEALKAIKVWCYEPDTDMESAIGILANETLCNIQACKEALAQPAKNIRDSFNEMLEDKVSYYKNKQSAQKPVAKGFIRSLVSIDKNGIETWKEEPFYTSPPSWQGLSDDEINNLHHKWIMNSGNKDTQYDFARAIEQALKEKNT